MVGRPRASDDRKAGRRPLEAIANRLVLGGCDVPREAVTKSVTACPKPSWALACWIRRPGWSAGLGKTPSSHTALASNGRDGFPQGSSPCQVGFAMDVGLVKALWAELENSLAYLEMLASRPTWRAEQHVSVAWVPL